MILGWYEELMEQRRAIAFKRNTTQVSVLFAKLRNKAVRFNGKRQFGLEQSQSSEMTTSE